MEDKNTKKLTIPQAFDLAVQAYGNGNLPQAKQICESILNTEDSFASAHDLLGVILFKQTELTQAVHHFEKAVQLDAKNAQFLLHLGASSCEVGDYQNALTYLEQAKQINPKDAQVYYNLGLTLQNMNHIDQAKQFYHQAIDLNPKYMEAYNNLGSLELSFGDLTKAKTYFQQCQKLAPKQPSVLNNIAQVHLYENDLIQAKKILDTIREQDANYADIYNSYGVLYNLQGQFDLEENSYRQAILLNPNNPDSHVNLALTLLANGQLKEGLAEYEWRLKMPGLSILLSKFTKPRWQGEALSGQTLLVNTEQGFGDALQFVQLLKFLKTDDNRIILRVRQPLLTLFEQIPFVNEVIGINDEIPDYDKHTPLLSIPYYMKFDPKMFKAESPYLFVSPEAIAKWQSKLQSSSKPKVGICWSGNLAQKINRFRKIELSDLLSINKDNKLQFYNLQLQVSDVDQRILTEKNIINLMSEVTDFADTAALIANLDLVITVDTAIAHLAAGLGKPVYLLQSALPDWRYLMQNNIPIFYPTMKVFQQNKLNAWDSVLADIQQLH